MMLDFKINSKFLLFTSKCLILPFMLSNFLNILTVFLILNSFHINSGIKCSRN